MSVNLKINDVEEDVTSELNILTDISDGIVTPVPTPISTPMSTHTLMSRETKIDISTNIKKRPLDILKDELKLKIDTINPLELLDYDYEEHISSTGDQYSRISYTGVEKSLEALYSNANETSSSAMDILATYVRGQKLIYMEAKDYCESHLNYYMMPAIFLSATASVLSPVSSTIYMGSIWLAALNAFISFLLAVVNYMKLDAKAEAHKISAHQYDKLQSMCEFSSGYFLLFGDQGREKMEKDIKTKIIDIEVKIKEIKATNKFLIP